MLKYGDDKMLVCYDGKNERQHKCKLIIIKLNSSEHQPVFILLFKLRLPSKRMFSFKKKSHLKLYISFLIDFFFTSEFKL